MNETPKIPDRRLFKLIELKKKWRIRTSKLSIHGDFDDVIVNQRIVMIYDFSDQIAAIEEAEKELASAKYKNQNKLLDTDDEHSMSSTTWKLEEKVRVMKSRLESLKRDHEDFLISWKVVEHKLKYIDWWPSTEVVYQVDKKAIDRFDEMSAHLPNYSMMIIDHNERLASQKTWMLETIVEEVKEEKKSFWQVKASNEILIPDETFSTIENILKRKMSEAKIAKDMLQILQTLADMYSWRITELKVLLESSLQRLKIMQNELFEPKSILQIAIADCENSSWFATMITLASAFDFNSFLSKYE